MHFQLSLIPKKLYTGPDVILSSGIFKLPEQLVFLIAEGTVQTCRTLFTEAAVQVGENSKRLRCISLLQMPLGPSFFPQRLKR